MSRNIVFEGWLTKSPPSKRIWRTKWRRRWFALRQSGELPGQYFLDYYADRNCRRLKGTINLDLCEQVDAGLHMERAGNGTLDPKLRGSVFTIQTQSRTYHLEADCEAEMEKWVDAICRVCGLRPTEEQEDTYQNNNAVPTPNDRYERPDTTGPYIPISECITGVRAQGQNAFTFDARNIVVSAPRPASERPTESRGQPVPNPPRIKITHVDFSENESNVSDEDCKSLNASQSHIPDWSVTKSFTRLAVKPTRHRTPENVSFLGPPVPPRPPKTFARSTDSAHSHRETSQSARVQDTIDPVQESISRYTGPGTPWLRVPRRSSHQPQPPSPCRIYTINASSQYSDDDDEHIAQIHHHPDDISPRETMQYSNLPPLPPVVDRALKPRYSSFGHITGAPLPPRIPIRKPKPKKPPEKPPPPVTILCTDEACAVKLAIEGHSPNQGEALRSDTLQYLDLDLQASTIPPKNTSFSRNLDIMHGKSLVAVDTESAYKTVDFLKTEAFNSTRQDAEALRSYQY